MKTIEERAKFALAEYTKGDIPWYDEYEDGITIGKKIGFKDGYTQGATEQKAFDKELIDMLIGELYTSRAYHLGITGLDSHEEIARKEKDGNCALIRGIDRTINYVRESMEE